MLIIYIFFISLAFLFFTYTIENKYWKQFTVKYGITIFKNKYNSTDIINIENVETDILEIIKTNKNYYLFRVSNNINEDFFKSFPKFIILKYIDDFFCCGSIKINENTINITYKIQVSGTLAILIIIVFSFYIAIFNQVSIVVSIIISIMILFMVIYGYYSKLEIIKYRMKWYTNIR
jgi:hypothetical protein